MNIILASQSSGRRRLLNQLGIKFKVQVSDYEEDMTLDLSPQDLVQHLALGKAKDVATKNPGAVVIGGDTILIFNGAVRGKPKDNDEALMMLQQQRGKPHKYYSGYAIVQDNFEVQGYAINTVWMRSDLTDQELKNYIERESKNEKPTTKAGAYSGTDLGGVLIEKTEGDYFSAIGLPLGMVVRDLKKFGINIL